MAYSIEEFDAVTDGCMENIQSIDNLTPSEGVKIERMDNVKGFEGQEVLVTGSPFEVADSLDSCEGDNIWGIEGDCGVISCANCLTLAGVDLHGEHAENILAALAVAEGGFLELSGATEELEWGVNEWVGANFLMEYGMLVAYGVESTIYSPEIAGGSIQDVAKAIEDGHVVVMNLNAGTLWNDSNCLDNGYANHAVTVTGTVRDTNGQLLALTICDSGNNDSCRVVPVDLLETCYTNSIDATVVISNESVR